jgi:hypothetical protein
MGRIYKAPFSGVTVAAGASGIQDIWEVLAGTGKGLLIHGWSLHQLSDVGDAAEEILRVQEVRGAGSVTSGSGGTSPTVESLNVDDAATGATIEVNNTTRMVVGSGALDAGDEFGWNIRQPWVHYYTPELRPPVKPGDRWTLALPAGPTDSLTGFGGVLWFEEV